MNFKRWLPTFLGFPIGGYIATATVGSLHDPVSAAAGGLVAGAFIGGAQWLALRSRGHDPPLGRLHGGGDGRGQRARRDAHRRRHRDRRRDAVGPRHRRGGRRGAVGAAGARPRVAAAWTAVTAAGWSLGWLVTSQVIVDIERGHHVFGASGALLVTLLTGLALRHLVAAARPATGVASLA